MMKLIALFMLFSLLACEGNEGSSSQPDSRDSRETIEGERFINEFMNLVNNHRKEMGLKALINVDSLAFIALDHSHDMATKEISFGHTGFSARCAEARVQLSGGNLCAENVAMGQKTAEAVFTSWMNSPSHRKNIENARLTHSGLGIAKTSTGTYYWTHLFLEKN